MTPIGLNDDRKVRFVKKFIFPFCLKNEIDCTVKWNVKLFIFQGTQQIESENNPSQAIVELHRIT